MDSSIDRVVPLDELDDYQIAEGDPDVRGWDVLSADGRKVGEVDNLLIDTDAMKVRYLDVDIDDDLLTDGVDRHVLIPIGFARLDESSDQVFVDGLNSDSIQQLPEYHRESLTADYANSLRGHFETDVRSGEPIADGRSTEPISDTRFTEPISTAGTGIGAVGGGVSDQGVPGEERYFADRQNIDETSRLARESNEEERLEIEEGEGSRIREDRMDRF